MCTVHLDPSSEMAASKVTFILKFGDIKKTLSVDSNTSPLNLNGLAATKCKISSPVTLLYYNTGLEDWFEVDEDYELTDKDTLKLVFVDEKGNIVEVNLSL